MKSLRIGETGIGFEKPLRGGVAEGEEEDGRFGFLAVADLAPVVAEELAAVIKALHLPPIALKVAIDEVEEANGKSDS